MYKRPSQTPGGGYLGPNWDEHCIEPKCLHIPFQAHGRWISPTQLPKSRPCAGACAGMLHRNTTGATCVGSWAHDLGARRIGRRRCAIGHPSPPHRTREGDTIINQSNGTTQGDVRGRMSLETVPPGRKDDRSPPATLGRNTAAPHYSHLSFWHTGCTNMGSASKAALCVVTPTYLPSHHAQTQRR